MAERATAAISTEVPGGIECGTSVGKELPYWRAGIGAMEEKPPVLVTERYGVHSHIMLLLGRLTGANFRGASL